MAHHSDKDLNKDLLESIRAQELAAIQLAANAQKMQESANSLGLGPTGEFPEGKLVDHDEGELKLAITNYQGKVVINFGTPVAFVGFTPEQALEIGRAIIEHAVKANNQS